MARLIKRLRAEPYPISIGGDTKYICGCGLSKNQPYCDGTHAKLKDEQAGKLYWYDSSGIRHETADVFKDIASN